MTQSTLRPVGLELSRHDNFIEGSWDILDLLAHKDKTLPSEKKPMKEQEFPSANPSRT
jgi:hypothetical protein